MNFKSLIKVLLLIGYFFTPSKQLLAQVGKQLAIAAVLPSASPSTIKIEGRTGFALDYQVFAKYSDRFEWTTGISYAIAPYYISCYEEEVTPGSFTSQIYSYKPTEVLSLIQMLNWDYTLNYYIIPDKLAIMGGLNFGFTFGNMLKEIDNPYFSKEDLSQIMGTTRLSNDISYNFPDYVDVNNLETSDEGRIYKGGNFGLQFGANYTFNDRIKLFAIYNPMLTKVFVDEDMNTILDNSKMRFLRIGIAFKFMPSYHQLRF